MTSTPVKRVFVKKPVTSLRFNERSKEITTKLIRTDLTYKEGKKKVEVKPDNFNPGTLLNNLVKDKEVTSTIIKVIHPKLKRKVKR